MVDTRPSWASSFDSMIARAKSESPAEREAARRRKLQDAERELALERLARRVERAREISDLGDRWLDRTLDKFQSPPGDARALQFARDFVDDPKVDCGLWFHGPVDIGKTHLCAGIILACGELGIPGALKTGPGFLRLIKSTYKRDGKPRVAESEVVEGLARIPLLVLDDIDKIKFNEWSGPLFWELLNMRYESNLPLLVTSNSSPADLATRWIQCKLDKMLAVSIVRRMREMCRIVHVAGESFRSKIA